MAYADDVFTQQGVRSRLGVSPALPEAARSDTRAQSPARYSGFLDNETTLYWLVLYLSLGALVLLEPRSGSLLVEPGLWAWALVADVVVGWPNWFRATSLGQIDRTVYSYVHWDVSRWSFLLQELRILGWFVLLSLIWGASSARHAREAHDPDNGEGAALTLSSLPEHARLVRAAAGDWQRDTVLLALAFLPWTWFFWRSVVVLGDPRYAVSAVLWHFVWLMTWWLRSAAAWRQIQTFRSRRDCWLAGLAKSDRASPTITEAVLLLQELDAPPRRQLVFTAAASLVTFVVPLVELAAR